MKALLKGAILFIMIMSAPAFTACGEDGGGADSLTETAPSAPGTATIIVAGAQFSLSWSAVDGATAYEVWFYTENDSSLAWRNNVLQLVNRDERWQY